MRRWQIGGSEVLIVARDLVEACMRAFGIDDYRILTDIDAARLERKRCRPSAL